MKVPVNEQAPVVARDQITIHAPIQTVWRLLAAIGEWPRWRSAVTSATLNGPAQEGAVFTWKAGGLSFTSRIHTFVPEQLLGWTGTTIGAKAVHNWTFTQAEGRTVVEVSESLQGLFPRLFKRSFQKQLEESMRQDLEELKQEAEA